MEIECNCGQKIEIADDFLGDFVICPKCKVAVKVDIFPRPKEKLKSALEYAAETVPAHCPGCGKAVVRRMGFSILSNDIRDGKCRHSQAPIAGVWQ